MFPSQTAQVWIPALCDLKQINYSFKLWYFIFKVGINTTYPKALFVY